MKILDFKRVQFLWSWINQVQFDGKIEILFIEFSKYSHRMLPARPKNQFLYIFWPRKNWIFFLWIKDSKMTPIYKIDKISRLTSKNIIFFENFVVEFTGIDSSNMMKKYFRSKFGLFETLKSKNCKIFRKLA